MEEASAQMSLVILDACRNVVFRVPQRPVGARQLNPDGPPLHAAALNRPYFEAARRRPTDVRTPFRYRCSTRVQLPSQKFSKGLSTRSKDRYINPPTAGE